MKSMNFTAANARVDLADKWWMAMYWRDGVFNRHPTIQRPAVLQARTFLIPVRQGLWP